jgi:hypothetical protein
LAHLVRAAHDFEYLRAVFPGCNDGWFVHLHRHVRFAFQQKQFLIPLGDDGLARQSAAIENRTIG